MTVGPTRSPATPTTSTSSARLPPGAERGLRRTAHLLIDASGALRDRRLARRTAGVHHLKLPEGIGSPASTTSTPLPGPVHQPRRILRAAVDPPSPGGVRQHNGWPSAVRSDHLRHTTNVKTKINQARQASGSATPTGRLPRRGRADARPLGTGELPGGLRQLWPTPPRRPRPDPQRHARRAHTLQYLFARSPTQQNIRSTAWAGWRGHHRIRRLPRRSIPGANTPSPRPASPGSSNGPTTSSPPGPDSPVLQPRCQSPRTDQRLPAFRPHPHEHARWGQPAPPRPHPTDGDATMTTTSHSPQGAPRAARTQPIASPRGRQTATRVTA
jgi:hypothetical protein